MAERDSWAVMDGSTRKVDAEDARLAMTALITPGATALRGRQGLRPGPGNPGLVTATGTPDINVKVEKFQAILTATRGLGEYIATLDADKTINILGDTPAHGTLQRNHLIIALQTDTYYGDGSTKFEVVEVIGIAGSGDPSLAAYSDYIPLARLRITAGATTVTSAMIDDLRPAWFVALGGLLPVKDQTERDALTAWNGYQIYRRDRKWVEIHDGTAWRVQGNAVCTSVADRNSAITHPYSGQLAVTTDSDTLWQYDGTTSAWICIAAKGVVARGNRPSASSTTATDTVDVAVLRVSTVRLLVGRLYKIWTSPLSLDSSSTNDEIGARVRFTTNNTNATTASTILPGSNVTSRQTDANVPDQRNISAVYAPNVDMTASFLLCVRRIAGAGNCSIALNAGEGDAIDLVIEDIGSDPGDTGTDL